MSTAIETFSTIVILILVILLFSHALNGTAGAWIGSKFHVDGGTTTDNKVGSGKAGPDAFGDPPPPIPDGQG